MSTREQRIEVFQDTTKMINSSQELLDSIDAAKKNTFVHYEDDYPAFSVNNVYDTEITVSKKRSLQAAKELLESDPTSKVAVMNFANAFHAGGGVTTGAGAQEESLCRTSTLYPLLYRRTLRDTFYAHNRRANTPKATDSLIYTKGVVVIKSDEDLPKRLPQEDWYNVDVITVAAPDLRSKHNIHVPGVGTYMNDAELFGYHVKRAMHILTCAAAHGADTLVLGAFGCGAFENNPEVVSKAYKVAINEFPKVFKKIEFAVYCGQVHCNNYNVFSRVLKNVYM